MKKMTSKEMTKVNGGRTYNYICDCGSKTRTKTIMLVHIALSHLGKAHWYPYR